MALAFMSPGVSPYMNYPGSRAPQVSASPEMEFLKNASNEEVLAARQNPDFPSDLVSAELARRFGGSNAGYLASQMQGRAPVAKSSYAEALAPLPQEGPTRLPMDDPALEMGGDMSAPMQGVDDGQYDANRNPIFGGARNPALAAVTQEVDAPPAAVVPDGANEDISQSLGGPPVPMSESDSLLTRIANRYLEAPDEKRAGNLALAKAGFAMASSRNPYLLGAVGEGGLAGLTEYENSRKNELDRQLKGATLLSQVDNNKARSQQRVDDLQYKYKALASAAQDRSLAREDRAAAAKQANETRLEIAKLTADTRATNNMITMKDGTLGTLVGGKVVPLKDEAGNPVSGSKFSGPGAGTKTLFDRKKEALTPFVGEEQATMMAAGQKAPDRGQIERIALQAEKAAAANEFSPTAAKAAAEAARQRIYDVFGVSAEGPATPASPTTKPASPAAPTRPPLSSFGK